MRSALSGRLLGGKWRLGISVGRGGTSEVYAATNRFGRSFAIKVLNTELGVSQRARARFVREAYLASRIHHAGVPVVFDDGVVDGVPYLVMELFRGATAEQYFRARGGRLSLTDALLIVERLLGVLAAAHASGIVHRDVKPSNVFLTSEGELKLLDFGIARLREGEGTNPNTASNVVLGTPGFIAPEQLLRGDIDARTDVWAVGATLMRLLGGPSASAPELAPALAIARRAMAEDPSARYADAAEMRRAVQSVLAPFGPLAFPRPPESGPASTKTEQTHSTASQATDADSWGPLAPVVPRWRVVHAAAIGGIVLLVVSLSARLVHSLSEPGVVETPRGASESGSDATITCVSAAAPETVVPPIATGVPPATAPASSVRRGAARARIAKPAQRKPPTRLEDLLDARH